MYTNVKDQLVGEIMDSIHGVFSEDSDIYQEVLKTLKKINNKQLLNIRTMVSTLGCEENEKIN